MQEDGKAEYAGNCEVVVFVALFAHQRFYGMTVMLVTG